MTLQILRFPSFTRMITVHQSVPFAVLLTPTMMENPQGVHHDQKLEKRRCSTLQKKYGYLN